MSFEHSIQRVMSGQARGPLPAVGRLMLAGVEPFYAAAARWRNRRFDRDPAAARRLPRPVVSVGNLTTGGTGKTPIVRWLAGRLRDHGLGVAILSRGYKAAPGTLGDEQRMLLALLGGDAADGESGGGGGPPGRPPLVIEADPDRFAAGTRVLGRAPSVDVFLLDDGFQHRRLHRDLDVVLLHAGEPFGYGHVLPRGLLREPAAGLRRAGAVVLTNADAADDARRAAAVAEVRRWNADCPVLIERHEPTGLRSPAAASSQPADVPLSALAGRAAFCFSGIASPGGFEGQVRALAGRLAGAERLPDHHGYTPADVARLRQLAAGAGADVLVTTEKDWVKLAGLPNARNGDLPAWRLDVEARFDPGDEDRLYGRVLRAVLGDVSGEPPV